VGFKVRKKKRFFFVWGGGGGGGGGGRTNSIICSYILCVCLCYEGIKKLERFVGLRMVN